MFPLHLAISYYNYFFLNLFFKSNFRCLFCFRQTAFLSCSCVHFCHYDPTHCLGCRSIQYRSIAPWQVFKTKVLLSCDVNRTLNKQHLMTSYEFKSADVVLGTRVTVLGDGGTQRGLGQRGCSRKICATHGFY